MLPSDVWSRKVTLGETRMSLLEHPTARALLADAEVSAAAVTGSRHRLRAFLQRYLPRFYRVEQRELAHVVLQGKLSNLQRKTSEPIAYQAGRQRKPVQHFVGAGCWDDEHVMAEFRQHVAEEDRKSTRLNSSHLGISYAVFCLKKNKT